MNRIMITALFKCVVESDFKTVKIKFVGKGAKEEEVEKYLEDFKKLRDGNRIKKINEKNIDYWGKQPFKDFTRFINDLKETKSKTQENKLKKMEGAELRGENELWSVYKITTHKASCFYGSGTKWCVTEKDSKNWNSYQKENDFYYFLSKTRDKEDPLYKIAMNINTEGEKQYWDAEDTEINLPSDIKKELPSFKVDKVSDKSKIIIDGKTYTFEEFYNAKNLNVKGNLNFRKTKITFLPEGLTVGGDLNLEGTKITSLPKGLEVGGDLNLEGTKITALPEDLKVGGDLKVYMVKNLLIPEDLEIGGVILDF